MVKRVGLIAGLAALGVAAAGCGGSGNTNTAGAGSASTKAAVTVKTAKVGKLGTVLVTSSGRTLYLFEKDARHGNHCTGSCAAIWPALTVATKPAAGSGVKASMLGTVKDSNGKSQVTYNGWPLYTYAADTKAGKATGEGLHTFGSWWYAVSASGSAAKLASSSSSSGSSSGGGGGW